MIILALLPPLWRRGMGPRVLAHLDRDMSRANTSPRTHRKGMAEYPPPQASRHEGGQAERSVPAAASGHTDPVQGGRCPGCGYVYDQSVGDPREGFPAGTPWSAGPDTQGCPDCGVREKMDFLPLSRAGAES